MIETPVTVAALEANVEITHAQWSAASAAVDPIYQKYVQAVEALEKEQLALGHVWTVEYRQYGWKYKEVHYSEEAAVDWANRGEDEGNCSVSAILRPDGSQLEFQETGIANWAVGK